MQAAHRKPWALGGFEPGPSCCEGKVDKILKKGSLLFCIHGLCLGLVRLNER